MAFIIKKKKGGVKEINSLAHVNLFIALATASVTTIWAIYINSFVNNISTTGFISGFLTFVSLISFLVLIPLIERSDKGKLFEISLISLLIIYILLALNKNLYTFLPLAIGITAFYAIRIATFGVIVKDKSKKQELSKNEGIIFTFLNIGWLIGPLIAGYITLKFGLNKVFLIAAFFILIAFFIFKYTKISDKHIKRKIDTNMLKNFIDFFKDKKRTIAYIIDGGSSTWWVLIYLYIPLLMIENGLNEKFIGYFLFALALPLIATEYKFSKLTEKYGFKKMFILGFSIILIFTLACFFLTNIYLILVLLIIASFGMAILEPATEAYFLETIKKEEASRFYPPYNTTRDITQTITEIISATILLMLPFKFVFVFFGMIMLIMIYVTNKI